MLYEGVGKLVGRPSDGSQACGGGGAGHLSRLNHPPCWLTDVPGGSLIESSNDPEKHISPSSLSDPSDSKSMKSAEVSGEMKHPDPLNVRLFELFPPETRMAETPSSFVTSKVMSEMLMSFSITA